MGEISQLKPEESGAMQLNHVGIAVADLQAADRFMTEVLGLDRVDGPPDPSQTAAMYRCGAIEIQLVQDAERLAGAPVGRLEHIAIDVEDLTALEARLCAAGAELQYEEPVVWGDSQRFRTQFTRETGGSLGVKFQLTERLG
jgi:catechol 2,3-dioxygenase-like lactoylglutathione lyase family enzyme